MPKHPDVTVQLTGRDGNAAFIIGSVTQALRRTGHADKINQFAEEAMSGDYHDLLRTVHEWVNVE